MISHVKAVFSLTGLASTPKFVLLALADMADAKNQCWPSIARLCEMTSFTERTVQGAISQLDKTGHIKRGLGGGRSNTTVYTLNVNGAAKAPFQSAENPADERINGASYAGNNGVVNPAANAENPAFAAQNPAANTVNGAADAPEENRTTKEENREENKSGLPVPPNDQRDEDKKPAAARQAEPSFPDDLPEEYRTPLRLWFQHKRERRESYKETGWAMLIRHQRKKPVHELIRDVEHSISQNYQGIYAPRADLQKTHQPRHKAYNHEDATRGMTSQEIGVF